jgi:hypothetical protein
MRTKHKDVQGWDGRDGRTMRKMLRVHVPFPRYIRGIHIKELGEQLDRALRTDVYGFHEGNHKGHQKLSSRKRPRSGWI